MLTFSQHLACPECGLSFEDLQPRNFSFNSPYGACPECSGIGTKFRVDPELVIADPSLSLNEGVIAMWSSNRMRYYHRLLTGIGEVFGFSMDTPWEEFDPEIQEKILYGTGEERITVQYTNRFGRKRNGMPPSRELSHFSAGDTDRPRPIQPGSTTRSTWQRCRVTRAEEAG